MIPIADPTLGAEESAAVADVLSDGRLADGPTVRDFESAFADYCGTAHAVATANGTTALHAALEALGIGDGDRVVTTPFSFVASANAVRLAGATPVFADIDPETYNLDPQATREAVRETDADAILVVHLYGLPAEMDAFVDIADDEDVLLVEDAAQAHGARYRGSPVGSFGDAAAFSFYPTKNMTTGEGGMVLTDTRRVAERAASYVNHGRPTGGTGYEHEILGHNFRMTSIAAAIGQIQLDRLPEWIVSRRENARQLSSGIKHVPGIVPPTEPNGHHHAYHQYTVRCDGYDRNAVASHLGERGVDSAVYYPSPIHRLGAYETFTTEAPVAEQAADAVLSLPVHPGLDSASIEQIIDSLTEFSKATETEVTA